MKNNYLFYSLALLFIALCLAGCAKNSLAGESEKEVSNKRIISLTERGHPEPLPTQNHVTRPLDPLTVR